MRFGGSRSLIRAARLGYSSRIRLSENHLTQRERNSGSWDQRPPRHRLRIEQGPGPRLRHSAGQRRRACHADRARRGGAEKDRRRNPQSQSRRHRHRDCRRHHHAGRPRGRAEGLSRTGYPDQQCRRSAARRFPQLDPRRLDQGDRRQHADADRADQGDGRRHDGAEIRPHRQHHLRRGEGADRHTGALQRRARRPHRLHRRTFAQDRDQQRHHQRPAAGTVRHRPPAR